MDHGRRLPKHPQYLDHPAQDGVDRQVPEPFEARIAADSKYWMWINDSLVVFEGGLKRGPNPEGTYYDVVDLSPYLKEGENTLAVLLWYFGKDGFSHKSSGKAGFLFDARKDGVSIVSDPSWQATVYQAFQHTGKPYPNYRLPESNIRYDARFALPGWNTTAFKGLLPPGRSPGQSRRETFRPSGRTPHSVVERLRTAAL